MVPTLPGPGRCPSGSSAGTCVEPRHHMSSALRPRPIRLTTRDQSLLKALSSYRLLSIRQLATLFFRGSTSAASTRLRRLLSHRLVVRVHAPVRAGTGSCVYGLSARGSHLLSRQFATRRPRFLREHEARSGLFLDHTLRRNDLRICLELVDEGTPGLNLASWMQEVPDVKTVVKLPLPRRRVARIPLVPDGFFTLQTTCAYESFVVEVDMGTVRPARMALRYRAYWHWWQRRGHRKQFGPAPLRVLTLTTNARRLEQLHKLASQAPGQKGRQTRLFWFALLDQVDIERPERLLEACWSVSCRPIAQRTTLINP